MREYATGDEGGVMKTQSKEPILWDDLYLSVYGPRGLQRSKKANRCVETLMDQFVRAIRQCLKAAAKRSPVLKRFRVEVEK